MLQMKIDVPLSLVEHEFWLGVEKKFEIWSWVEVWVMWNEEGEESDVIQPPKYSEDPSPKYINVNWYFGASEDASSKIEDIFENLCDA